MQGVVVMVVMAMTIAAVMLRARREGGRADEDEGDEKTAKKQMGCWRRRRVRKCGGG